MGVARRRPQLVHKFILNSAGAGALVATLLCGCVAMPRGVTTAAQPQVRHRRARAGVPAQPFRIGVLIAGWHTGLILTVRELGPLRSLLPVYPGERYLSFGWGNRRFYMSSNPSVSDALDALFPSPSAVLVEGAPTLRDLLPPAATYRWLCADRKEALRIDIYLLDSLRERGGRPIVLGAGPTSQSEFLASGERYDAFDTCNSWTAAALERAGFPVRAAGVLFASQLKDRVGNLPECQRTVGGHGPVAKGGPASRDGVTGQRRRWKRGLGF